MEETVNPPIAVIDTNVLFSFRQRKAIITAISQGRIDGIWSPHIVGELYRVLAVEWIQEKGSSPASVAEMSRSSKRLMELLSEALIIIDPGPQEYENLPDPDDFHLIRAARVANAQWIVSNNTHDFPPAITPNQHVYDGVEYITYDTLMIRLGGEELFLPKTLPGSKTGESHHGSGEHVAYAEVQYRHTS